MLFVANGICLTPYTYLVMPPSFVFSLLHFIQLLVCISFILTSLFSNCPCVPLTSTLFVANSTVHRV